MTSLNLFDTQVDKFDKYTQIPFTEDKLLQAYIYRGNQSRYNAQRRDYDILPLSNLFDFIDVDVITEILCQKPVTDLMEAVNDYNESYKHICFDMHRKKIVDYERFDLALTKSLAWKAGTYAHILKVIDYFEGRHMRAAGMESLFKRRVNNDGYIDFHRNRLNRLDTLRATAKRMVGSKETDASKYKDRMLNTMDTINKTTEEGNNVSDKIRISHYFTTNEYNSDEPYTFLDTFLITRVDIEPMMMFYTKGSDVVFKIEQPAMTTFYPRPLYKVLNGDRKHDHTLFGYSKAKHSYLQDYSIWHPNGNNVTKSPWNTVCLSGHSDDVLRNMSLHKYGDAAYALTLWGSSYNLEHTNPYNGPNQLIYQQGFDKFVEINNDEDDNAIEYLTDVLGINNDDCFSQRLHKHRAVWLEETPNGHRIVNKLDDSQKSTLELFAHPLIEECKNCPVIDNCYKMQRQLEYEKVRDEYLPIVEAIVAITYEEVEYGDTDVPIYDLQWSIIEILQKLAKSDYDKCDSIIIDRLDKAGFFKEPLTAEEQKAEDVRIAQLQAQKAMEQWALGATHGDH
jgi:hypothetical protein